MVGVNKRLEEIIYPVAKELDCEIMELEVMPEHVHVLCEVAPQFGAQKIVRRVKGVSSHMLRQKYPHIKSRLPILWTHSYFVSTVGGYGF